MAFNPERAPSRLDAEAAGARVGELFELHGRLVFGVCRLLLRNLHEAEDATQQTFLSAYRSLLSGHDPREPAAWLGTIARNECRARVRARMAEPLYAVSDAPDERSTEQEVGRRGEVAALTEALAGLPQRQREAIVLREFYGLSHDEVALALGVSASAVDSLLVRARKRLQKELRPARVASGMLALPVALRETLGQTIPGFLSETGSGGIAAKLASLPLVAKLAGATATVSVVGVVGGVAVQDRPTQVQLPRAAVSATGPSHGAAQSSVHPSIRSAGEGAALVGDRADEEEDEGNRGQGRDDDDRGEGAIEEHEGGAEGEDEAEQADPPDEVEAPEGDGGGESGSSGDEPDSGDD